MSRKTSPATLVWPPTRRIGFHFLRLRFAERARRNGCRFLRMMFAERMGGKRRSRFAKINQRV